MVPSHKEIADAYLEYAHRPNETAPLHWTSDHIFDLRYEGRWEDIWQIILAVTRREEIIDTERLAFISAGPLEDLICEAGPEFIERIEHEAKFNRQFGKLLTGVWLSRAEPSVRERVVRFCRAFPDPIDGEYRY